ncbi:glycosyltransferase involved in cell wall biosynthesis [Mucilaginibacter gracilis]|uniref:Glycosyltransferase involved in cell wall biosynthesis n=1 Tax=Mucilaginibacter gracilis TaxID=423350 RepID=A0A495J4L8_9SPHI|nr:glycosyltransferase family 4 protein [Mucilaginibacter gracilis]RKR83542.1 glycosyltransferase involved in cell wall biosynthesis [Mucilaginibacter gracilis]
MRFVFASYCYTPEYKRPEEWLNRVKFYGGILEALALHHTVISIEQIDYEGALLHNGVQYYFKRTSKFGRKFPVRLHRFIMSLESDFVFVHGLHFPLQLLQLRAYLGSQVKIMVQHHAELPGNGMIEILQQLADRYINAYLFASHNLGLNWVNRGNLASVQKIHEVMEVSSVFYPIDRQSAISKTGVKGAPVFLWVARLEQKKDPLNVVRAFLEFAKINTGARLYMIYHVDDLLSNIHEVLNEYADVSGSIVLVGQLQHDDLIYWYNSADFIISGSIYEGAGTAICEAISCGLFPVLTAIPSFQMMTGNGKFGLLYEAGNKQELLNCLLKTAEVNIQDAQVTILDHYKTELSFSAIAGKISQIASSL